MFGVTRTIGPWLPVSAVADTNLRHAMPELDSADRRRIIRGVWDNLGRTAAELPHLPVLQRTADGPGWECRDDTELRKLKARSGPAILFSGHLANWEIGLSVAATLDLRVSWFYRAASNPVVDRLLGYRGRAVPAQRPAVMAGAAVLGPRRSGVRREHLAVLQRLEADDGRSPAHPSVGGKADSKSATLLANLDRKILGSSQKEHRWVSRHHRVFAQSCLGPDLSLLLSEGKTSHRPAGISAARRGAFAGGSEIENNPATFPSALTLKTLMLPLTFER